MAHDVIIVGAGTAGCVLAARLTEDEGRRVLLIEAGPPDTDKNIEAPAAFPKLFKTPLDWAYETEPQEHAGGRRFFMPRGKMLGGCSSMNAMLYVRGNRADYDGWADATGDPGWSYEGVRGLFDRSVTNERGAPYAGGDGPLQVSDQRSPLPVSRAFIEAAVALGHERNADFNGPDQEGFGLYQVTQKKGARHSAAGAFLRPALRRPNLDVVTGALVRRVVIEGGRARAVELRTAEGEARREVEPGGEVIICAGALNTPQLLMLSGIGEAAHLGEHGIDVVADLPGVGQNLQDHVYATMVYRAATRATLDVAESFPGVLANIARYMLLGRGPFTSCVAEAGGFIRTEPDLAAPDMQYHFAPVLFLDHGFTRAKGCFCSLGPTLLTPASRGTVRLASADPTEPPRIDPRFLGEESDVRALVRGYRIGRDILESDDFSRWLAEAYLPAERLVGEKETADYIRAKMDHVYHPVGTAKMGRDDDPDAVVDPELRVRGIEGLRVADASIMPTITRGNTNAPTMMIAEKAAELIRSS